MRVKKIKYHENLLRVIAEVEDYAILFMDIDGIIQSWNRGAQKIHGYRKSEIIGKSYRCFYNSEDIKNKKPEILIDTALKYGRAHDEGWRLRKDGSSFWGSVTITTAYDESGHVVGFGKLTKDLTEHRLAEHAHELELKNRELEQFNYIASHDLLEPLRTVSNFVRLIEEENIEHLSDTAKYHLEVIKASTSRMTILVKALLGYSRLGKDGQVKPVDLNNLLKQVLNDLSNLIENRKAEIKIEPLPVILGFETELRQLFQNLIDNAIKFQKEGTIPKVEIGYSESFSEYEFFIRDNGIGIDRRNYHKIFNIFQRLHKQEEFPGFGIGLANCKKIAEIHNGRIWVDSMPEKGSTFKFIISKFIK